MFGSLFGGEKKLPENWNQLESIDSLEEIIEASHSKKQVIFKHSTRCSISSMAYNRLQDAWQEAADKAEFYYLDLIQYRAISNAIADRLGVMHQSPQLLVIENGKCIAHGSHNNVSVSLV